MKFKRKKIFITGIGGYVGSALAQKLSPAYDVVGYGHLGDKVVLSKLLGSRVKLVEGDITNAYAILKASRGAYAVIHTAAPTTEKFCKEHPWEAVQAIVRGTAIVRDVVVKNKIPLLIHFSSQAVYSNFKVRSMPLRESMELLPDSLYGAFKAEAEWELTQNKRGRMFPVRLFCGLPIFTGAALEFFGIMSRMCLRVKLKTGSLFVSTEARNALILCMFGTLFGL